MGISVAVALGLESKLRLAMGDLVTRELMGTAVDIQVLNLSTPRKSEIPDLEEERRGIYGIEIGPWRVNRSYYRELTDYIRITEQLRGFNIAVSNDGDIVAQGVRVIFEFPDDEDLLRFMDESDVPGKPRSKWAMFEPNLPRVPTVPLDVVVRRHGQHWRVEVSLGKIQPKDTAWSRNLLFLGAKESGTFILPAQIFADNLAKPERVEVQLRVDAINEAADLDRIRSIEEERFMQSAEYRRLIGVEEDQE